MTLGQRLRWLRLEHDPPVRLREVAARLGVLFVTWSHYESDRERPSRDLLVRVADLFDADVSELLELWEQWQEAPPVDLSQNICRKVW